MDALSVWIHTHTDTFSIASLTFTTKQVKTQRPYAAEGLPFPYAVPYLVGESN